MIGFFAVLGIAARNGIMMVSHFQHLERHEGEAFARRSSCAGRSSGWRRSS